MAEVLMVTHKDSLEDCAQFYKLLIFWSNWLLLVQVEFELGIDQLLVCNHSQENKITKGMSAMLEDTV